MALLSRFFDFYASDFQWGSEVVSVRLGRRVQVSSPEFYQLQGQAVRRLHIEDPFLLNRNLNCVLGQSQESQLKAELSQASWAAGQGLTPGGLARAHAAIQHYGASANLAQSQHRFPELPTDKLITGEASSTPGKDNIYNTDTDASKVLLPEGDKFTGIVHGITPNLLKHRKDPASRKKAAAVSSDQDDRCTRSGNLSQTDSLLHHLIMTVNMPSQTELSHRTEYSL